MTSSLTSSRDSNHGNHAEEVSDGEHFHKMRHTVYQGDQVEEMKSDEHFYNMKNTD